MDDAFLRACLGLLYVWTAWQFSRCRIKGGHHELEGGLVALLRDFPLWRMSYDIIRYFRHTFGMKWNGISAPLPDGKRR